MKQQRSKFKPDEVPETDEILEDRELGLDGFASEWDLQLFREAQVNDFLKFLKSSHFSRKNIKIKYYFKSFHRLELLKTMKMHLKVSQIVRHPNLLN